MHLNTSPTSFEGSGTGKYEKTHNALKHLKLDPKKQLLDCNLQSGLPYFQDDEYMRRPQKISGPVSSPSHWIGHELDTSSKSQSGFHNHCLMKYNQVAYKRSGSKVSKPDISQLADRT